MKTIALTAPHTLGELDAPDPAIQNDKDVLLRIAAVGVCGSDVHYYKTGRIGDQVVEYPYVVGHECSATVLEVGAGVARVKPGDRVAVDPAVSCWECDQCRAGRPHTCRKLKFLGCPGQIEGSLKELLVMPEASCYPIRASTTFAEAVIAEPLSIGLYTTRVAGLTPETRVGILGFGPIGLSVMLAARAGGAGHMYVTDRIDARLDIARSAGALWTGNPDTDDVVGEVGAAVPELLDVVIECCGEQDAIDQGVELLAPGGKLVVVGIPEVDRVSFSSHEVRRRELTVVNVRRQNDCVQPALDLLESGRIDANTMLTHFYPFARTPEAFDLVEGYQDGVMKAVIELQ